MMTFPILAQKLPGDDIILKAMQDELNRNMTDLFLPNFDKPFFIMYGVLDQKTYSVVANLGSLTQSAENPQRFKTTTRVLVGDYTFNDESLDDNLFSAATPFDIGLPLDDDYYGIRRGLWSTTDNVYRDATRHFAEHKETVKESGKVLADIPHRSFTKSEPVKFISSVTPYAFDRAAWEEKARTLSALFLHHSSIVNSGVVIQYSEGHNYLVSSEGTVVKVPFRVVTFMALGQSKNNNGEFSMDQVVHYASTPAQLPTDQQLATEITDMIAKIEADSTTPKFDDEYTGPVLLIGSAVASVFSSVLFDGRESLRANHNISRLTGFQFNEGVTSMDGKIGKPILHESVSVKLKPKLKSFNGTDLLGSFEIDAEGMIPPDELLVVDKGILKNLLNDRTITQPTQKANGFSSGPGVIEVTIAQKDSEAVLKEKLIAQAKRDGLDYAIIVRNVSTLGMGMGMLDVYKVSLTDGREQRQKNAIMNQANLKILKHILGASDQYHAYNLGGGGYNLGARLTSVIAPESVLLEEMQIQPSRMPSLKEEDYVSSPLK